MFQVSKLMSRQSYRAFSMLIFLLGFFLLGCGDSDEINFEFSTDEDGYDTSTDVNSSDSSDLDSTANGTAVDTIDDSQSTDISTSDTSIIDTNDTSHGIDTQTEEPECIDNDSDGWCWPIDCDDDDPSVHPGAYNIPGSGRDEDCSGFDAPLDTGGDDVHPCLSANPPPTCMIEPSTGPVCGNGILEEGEECDDGNRRPGDGCSGACKIEPYYVCPKPGEPCISTIECGNGILEPGEQCDEGEYNTNGCIDCRIQPGWRCTTPGLACELIVQCGDGRAEGDETCDEGAFNTDGCIDCQVQEGWICAIPGRPCVLAPYCGDGIVQPNWGEQCDDGNNNDGDGCSANCQLEPGWRCLVPGEPCELVSVCGNGIIEPGETCDEGEFNTNGCIDCQIQPGWRCLIPGQACERTQVCGNGILESPETCDEGTFNTEGCIDCQIQDGWICAIPGRACEPAPYCGDGIVQINRGEQCDEGAFNTNGCINCQIQNGWICAVPGQPCVYEPVVCGDGIIGPGEECDDGNTEDGDGCSSDCKLEPGYICPYPGAPCITVCGDGIVAGSEQCDDGNTNDGDGCSSDCQWEEGWACRIVNQGPPVNYDCVPYECGDTPRDTDVWHSALPCNDGNLSMGDGCTPFCEIEPICTIGAGCTSVCGDGLVIGNEECDDGNTLDGDGCSSDCKIEPGFNCYQPPLGNTMAVTVIYKDFSSTHPDFEPNAMNCNNASLNMVEQLLASGTTAQTTRGKPVLRTAAQNQTGCQRASTRANFAQWYNHNSDVHAVVPDRMILYPNDSGGFTNTWLTDGTRWQVSAGGGQEGEVFWCANEGGTCDDCYNPDHWWGPFTTDTMECLNPCTPWNNSQVCARVIASSGDDMISYWGNPVFFPIDGRGLNDPALIASGLYDSQTYEARIAPYYGANWELEATVLANNGITPPQGYSYNHNFHFTSEVRFWFEYDSSQDQVLEFLGDDDVWVFVNGQLVLDLGGIHVPLAGTVDLNTLGLTNGVVYEIVVFHAERQTTGSSYQLTLSGFNTAPSVCEPICGDAIVVAGEQCDLGTEFNTGEYGTCNPDCTLPSYCGDGVVDAVHAEECDNGINLDMYGSTGSNACAPGCVLPPYCGDGIVHYAFGETCDDGLNDGSYGGCNPDCSYGPYCGDAIVQSQFGETCDDGVNNGSYGGCNPDCTFAPYCGDGIIQPEFGEECESDDDVPPGFVCSANCRIVELCGNGVLDPGEECDDGFNTGGYGQCAPGCIWGPYCGDSIVQFSYGEQCDDGINDGSYGGCNPDCSYAPFCGDGDVNGNEECDDGINNGTYGTCNPDCTLAPKCGDGIIQPEFGEECDGSPVNGRECGPDCRFVGHCGDGILQPGEECDFGEAFNTGEYGGCNPDCTYGPYCGDGIVHVEHGEQCDFGEAFNTGEYGGCKPDCTFGPYCGDGIVDEPHEECDDGNSNHYDECNNFCQINNWVIQ